MSQANYAIAGRTIKVWFHGWTHNATPGSRTRITDTIKNGYVFCFDPEATADADADTTNSTANRLYVSAGNYVELKGSGEVRRYANVTRPATANLRLVAGCVVGLPPEGLLGTTMGPTGYLGGAELTLQVDGYIEAWTHANQTFGATSLGCANDDWGFVAITTTTATNNQDVAARSMRTVDTSSTAARALVRLGGPALPAWAGGY